MRKEMIEMIKKTVSILLAALLTVSPLTAYAMPYEEYMQGRGTYQTTVYNLSPGLTYTEVLSSNAKYGYEQSYIYHYTPGMGTEIRPVYGEYLYGTNTLKTLTAKAEANGDRVVGGINGDFYGMSTGIPIGAMIVDGEIITSDNERAALGFDAQGKAFISYPEMVTELRNDVHSVTVDHINKVPGEYGVYLLTDTYSTTTTSSKPSAEIVLMPYGKVTEYQTEEELPENLPEGAFVYRYPDSKTSGEETDITVPYETKSALEDMASGETDSHSDRHADTVSARPEEGTAAGQEEKKTETEKTELEETAEKPYYARVYEPAEETLHIGSEIPVVVKEFRYDSVNSSISEGCFVLSAENENQLYRVADLFLGEELTLTVTANEEWYGAVSAVGNTGGLILKDGQYCDDVEMSHYPYANPRTAVGITEDGTVIFYCVDGRKNGTSGGLRIDQLSHEMKNLGCITAMNLDGGGSTTVYAALPGANHASLMNTPSDGSERKTANSLLFVNTTGRSGSVAYCEMPVQNSYVLAGGSRYTIGKPVATDMNRYPVNLSDDVEYEYFLQEEAQITEPGQLPNRMEDGNIFISGDQAGYVDIYVRITEKGVSREYPAGSLYVLGTPQSFSVGTELTFGPFDSQTIPFTARYHTVKLYADIASVRWAEFSMPEDGGEVDLTTLDYQSVPENSFLETDSVYLSYDGTLAPKVPDKTVHLAAKIGECYQTLTVHVEPYPFVDSFDHWAAKTLYTANRYGLMQGEPVEEGYAFCPDRTMSKTEFLIVLARMLYPDIDIEPSMDENKEHIVETSGFSLGESLGEAPEETSKEVLGETLLPEELTEETVLTEGEEELLSFADAGEIPDWAKKYYVKLNQAGLLDFITVTDENGSIWIAPQEPITRRQVLIMLGALCPENDVDFLGVFTDTETLREDPYSSFINNAIAAEIFLGYDDGSLKPENQLTRAEAATVMVRFCQDYMNF